MSPILFFPSLKFILLYLFVRMQQLHVLGIVYRRENLFSPTPMAMKLSEAPSSDSTQKMEGSRKQDRRVLAAEMSLVHYSLKFTHLLIRSLANLPLTPLFTYSPLIHFPIHLLTYSTPHSPPHSLTHSLTHPVVHFLSHSLTHSPTHSLTHPLTCSLTHALAHSLTQ